jgi:AhpD family alkylhydroperoxidase
MDARMTHPAFAVDGAMAALQALGSSIAATGLSPTTVELVNMRASQINRCAVCLEGGLRDALKSGESVDRLMVLAGWRDSPAFTDAERAALALTEAVTRLSDNSTAVPDDVWDAAASQSDEPQLAALVLQIASINVWNRLNIATAQPAGAHTW